MDRLLDIREATFTQGVREMACRLACDSTSFDKGAANLDRCAHVAMGKETMRRLVEEEGRRVAKMQNQGELTPDFSPDACETPEGEARLYLGCDGVKVPLITDAEKKKRRASIRRKRQRCGKKRRPLPRRRRGADQAWKEARVVAIYNETQSCREVRCTRGNHTSAGRLMRRMATETRFSQAEQRIALIDGAPWIRNEIELHGLTQEIGLDYFHLRDNAQKARQVLFGDAEEGQAWRDRIMGLFYTQGVQAGIDALFDERKKRRGRQREAIDRLLGYVVERTEMIRYPTFRRRGWQIGSGPTEAQCKTSTSRVKGRGRRWDAKNAESIMTLSCLSASRGWERYWTTFDQKTA